MKSNHCGAFASFVLLLGVTVADAQVSLFDPSFQVGTGADGAVNAMAILNDQSILIGGQFQSFSGHSNSFLAHLSADGVVDPTFNLPRSTDKPVTCMLRQPDGKILVGGEFNTLLGVPRRGLARLLPDGSIDSNFDPGMLLAPNNTPYGLGLQPDGCILIGFEYPTYWFDCGITKALPDGTPDLTFTFATAMRGNAFAFLPLPDGKILVGGNFFQLAGVSCAGLMRLDSGGSIDATFDPGLETNSTVFGFTTRPTGEILVSGQLTRANSKRAVPLLQLSPQLQWDDSFTTAVFDSPVVQRILLQPDGTVIAGGPFFVVDGYWRRHIVRLTPAGRVDPCFDPGLGLGNNSAAPVLGLVLQPDGRVLVAGDFQGVDGHDQNNITRLLPQSDCAAIRVVMLSAGVVAATFPPGGPNILERSTNLSDWSEVSRATDPYIFYYEAGTELQAFFRAKQQR